MIAVTYRCINAERAKIGIACSCDVIEFDSKYLIDQVAGVGIEAILTNKISSVDANP